MSASGGSGSGSGSGGNGSNSGAGPGYGHQRRNSTQLAILVEQAALEMSTAVAPAARQKAEETLLAFRASEGQLAARVAHKLLSSSHEPVAHLHALSALREALIREYEQLGAETIGNLRDQLIEFVATSGMEAEAAQAAAAGGGGGGGAGGAETYLAPRVVRGVLELAALLFAREAKEYMVPAVTAAAMHRDGKGPSVGGSGAGGRRGDEAAAEASRRRSGTAIDERAEQLFSTMADRVLALVNEESLSVQAVGIGLALECVRAFDVDAAGGLPTVTNVCIHRMFEMRALRPLFTTAVELLISAASAPPEALQQPEPAAQVATLLQLILSIVEWRFVGDGVDDALHRRANVAQRKLHVCSLTSWWRSLSSMRGRLASKNGRAESLMEEVDAFCPPQSWADLLISPDMEFLSVLVQLHQQFVDARAAASQVDDLRAAVDESLAPSIRLILCRLASLHGPVFDEVGGPQWTYALLSAGFQLVPENDDPHSLMEMMPRMTAACSIIRSVAVTQGLVGLAKLPENGGASMLAQACSWCVNLILPIINFDDSVPDGVVCDSDSPGGAFRLLCGAWAALAKDGMRIMETAHRERKELNVAVTELISSLKETCCVVWSRWFDQIITGAADEASGQVMGEGVLSLRDELDAQRSARDQRFSAEGDHQLLDHLAMMGRIDPAGPLQQIWDAMMVRIQQIQTLPAEWGGGDDGTLLDILANAAALQAAVEWCIIALVGILTDHMPGVSSTTAIPSHLLRFSASLSENSGKPAIEASEEDILVIVSQVLLKYAEEETKMVQNGVPWVRPATAATVGWGIGRWSVSYLLPVHSLRENDIGKSPSLAIAFGPDSRGASQVAFFLLERLSASLLCAVASSKISEDNSVIESRIAEQACAMIGSASDRSVLLSLLSQMDAWWEFISAFSASSSAHAGGTNASGESAWRVLSCLSPHVLRDLGRAVVQISAGSISKSPFESEDRAEQARQACSAVFVPLSDRIPSAVQGTSMNGPMSQDASHLVCILSLLRGAAEARGRRAAEICWDGPIPHMVPMLLEALASDSIPPKCTSLVLQIVAAVSQRSLKWLPHEATRSWVSDAVIGSVNAWAALTEAGPRRCLPSAEDLEAAQISELGSMFDMLSSVMLKEVDDASLDANESHAAGPEMQEFLADAVLAGLKFVSPHLSSNLLAIPSIASTFFDLLEVMLELHPDRFVALPEPGQLMEAARVAVCHADIEVAKCGAKMCGSLARFRGADPRLLEELGVERTIMAIAENMDATDVVLVNALEKATLALREAFPEAVAKVMAGQ